MNIRDRTCTIAHGPGFGLPGAANPTKANDGNDNGGTAQVQDVCGGKADHYFGTSASRAQRS